MNLYRTLDPYFAFLFGVFDLLENFSLTWRYHHHRWRAANFDLSSVLIAMEQWRFFSVPHLLWHGASFYNGHLHGPVTVTPIAKPSLPVFTTYVCRSWDSNTQPSACSVYRCTGFFFKNKTLYNLKILDKIYIMHFLLKFFLREMVEASLWGSLSLMPSYGYFWLSDIICIFSVIWNIQQVFFMDFFLQFNCMSTSN